ALRTLDGMASVPAGGGTRPAGGNGAPQPSGNGPSAVAQSRMPQVAGGGQTMWLVDTQPREMRVAPAPEPYADAVPVKSLADIANLADQHRDMALKILVKRCVRLVSVEPGRLDVTLTNEAPKTLLGDLTVKLKAWTGRPWLVSLSREEGSQTIAEVETEKREIAILDAKSDPTVAAILAKFPGSKIIDIRIPDAPEAVDEDAPPPPELELDDDDDLF
ncbi:DNA polymerase III subunit gamma/tau, partial [Rhizobiaceae sp. 2RAB30]